MNARINPVTLYDTKLQKKKKVIIKANKHF